jgi:alkyl sulfatase BDS1-like metallo-beta-lactamase superfamily hydrolase
MTILLRTLFLGVLMAGSAAVVSAQGPKPAEPGVAARNRAVLSELPFSDRRDFEDAMRGFVATVPNERNPQRYDFLKADAPPTVNPSLWRLAQLNAIHGLFKVVDGIYQVRGFSLGNMTVVEGQTGIIVIDPLSSIGSAEEALALLRAPSPETRADRRLHAQPRRSLRGRERRDQRHGRFLGTHAGDCTGPGSWTPSHTRR